MYLLLCVILVNLAYGCTQQFSTKGVSGLEYGPYQMDWSYFELCKGPRAQNMTHVDAALAKSPDDKYTCVVNTTFLAPASVDEVKIDVFRDSSKKVLLWHYNIKNPCKHFVLGPVFLETYGTDSNCVAKKGTVTNTINMSDMSNKFFGPKFFYGTFIYKVNVLSKKGNVFCCNQKITFSKRT